MDEQVLLDIVKKMRASIEALGKDLATIRTSRASPALVEHIKVDYMGVATSLNHIAGITIPEVNLIVIQPWDRSNLRNIEKAIQASDLGLNPMNDGNIIRLSIPPITEERRRELTKIVWKRVEDKKVVVRNLRREAMNGLKKLERDKTISQDEHKRMANQLQQITDGFIADSDQAGRDKETDLSEV
ncbi:ribosome recycling factor [Chloroflexota bacterium]